MKTNYHSHTKWCRHGSGDIEDFILEAIKNGLEIYGVSEHIPYPGLKDCRMYFEELDDFIKELDFLQNKYKDKITILKGLECEYFEEFHDYYLDIKSTYNLDYLILGQHYKTIKKLDGVVLLEQDFFNNSSVQDIKDYEKGLIKGINSGLFDFIAHPDVYICEYPFDEAAKEVAHNIFKVCQDKNMPVEINANGVRYKRGYPNWDFWKLSKDYKLTYLINSDCHNVDEVLDSGITKTYKKAKDLGLNIQEYLTLK